MYNSTQQQLTFPGLRPFWSNEHDFESVHCSQVRCTINITASFSDYCLTEHFPSLFIYLLIYLFQCFHSLMAGQPNDGLAEPLVIMSVNGNVIKLECFHSRDYQPYWFTETTETICIKIECVSQRFSLGHQHGRRDVIWTHSFVVCRQHKPAIEDDLPNCDWMNLETKGPRPVAISVVQQNAHVFSMNVLFVRIAFVAGRISFSRPWMCSSRGGRSPSLIAAILLSRAPGISLG